MDAPRIVLRGRSTESERAETVLRTARSHGRGVVLVITGEAGIGKTALLEAIRVRARDGGFAVGSANATAVDDVAAGALLMLALRSGVEPLLDYHTFLGLASVYDQRLWLADQLADALEARAQRQPVLIALDDFQFADPLSRFLVRALTGRLAGSPIVWAIARRGTWVEAGEDIAAAGVLDPEIDVDHLALGPLDDDDIVAVAADVVGHPMPARASHHLQAAAGNPLLATQFAAEIATGSFDVDRGAIPASLLASLRARTRTLTATTEQLLHVSAVWGRPLALADAAELLGLVSTQDVLERARGAVLQGLLDGSGDAIDFRHDLIREFFYSSLSRSAKLDLHRRCAALLLQGSDGSAIRASPHAQALAQLGDTGAATTLRAAAEQCITVLPHVAADLARGAFTLLGRDDPTRLDLGERCAEILVQAHHGDDAILVVDEVLRGTSEPNRRARLQVIAAHALWRNGELADIVERVEATVALDGIRAELLARLTALKALALTRIGSSAEATETALAALRMQDESDPEVVSITVQALGHAARNEGRFEQAWNEFHSLRTRFGAQHLPLEIMALQSLDRYPEAQAVLDEATRSSDAHSDVALLDLLVAQQWQEWHLGHLDAAVTTARSVVRLSEELGVHASKIQGWTLLSIYAVLHKEFDRAAELVRQAGRIGAREWASQPELTLVRGYVDAATGDNDAAVAVLAPMVSDATTRHHYWPRSQEWPRLLAGAAVAGGHTVLAAQCVAHANLLAHYNPNVATILGIAAQTRGFVGHDLRELRNAAAILADAPRTMLHARARFDLGRALLDDGQHRQASSELERALSIYQRLDLPLYVDQVRAALDGAGHSRHRPHQARPQFGWGALTDAEHAVAEQIASGRTNRVAAEALHVSVHTVNTHVRSIFTKLDLHSRVQLANAWNTRPVHGTW
ncbi:AAA family ATPase [Mycobacterium sp.]|uniref:AAA family ATPase n=1 Tax=Mycobacterium sp. TaxID=1785 RepID=UPI003D0BAD31